MKTHAPIRTARRSALITWGASVPLAAAAWIWALWRQDLPGIEAPEISPRAFPAALPPEQTLDLSAFDVSLWVVPPAPVAKAPEPPPSPAELVLDLQLIGIVRDDLDEAGVLRAAIYDPRSDRIFIVAGGDQVGPHTVRNVTESNVEISSGRSVAKLLLDARAKPPSRKGGRS
jgi:hypothetical protein